MTKLYRHNRNADSPANSNIGYSMWCVDADAVSSYGPYAWTYNASNLKHIDDYADIIRDQFLDALESGMLPTTVEDMGVDLLDELNPARIVDSAGAWDDLDFVSWFWHNVGERHNIIGFLTDDGGILFDHDGCVRE